MAKFAEDPAFKQLFGWKNVPELINGRLSMLGATYVADWTELASKLSEAPILWINKYNFQDENAALGMCDE
jgi:hypothetical protein